MKKFRKVKQLLRQFGADLRRAETDGWRVEDLSINK